MHQRHSVTWPIIGLGLALAGLAAGLAIARAAPGIDLPEDLVTCLKDGIGGAAFAEISSGSREPSEEEKTIGEVCFGQQGQPPPAGGSVPSATAVPSAQPSSKPSGVGLEFSLGLRACLEEQFGQARFAEMLSGTVTAPTDEERTRAETCFAQFGKPNLPAPTRAPTESRQSKPTFGMPAGMIECLKQAVGEEVFAEVSTGRPPNPEEMAKGEVCFKKFEKEFREKESQGRGPVGIDPEKEACVKRIMGDQFEFAKVSGQVDLEKKKQVSKECFGQDYDESDDSGGGRPVVMPEETLKCLEEAFGQEVAEKMRQGDFAAVERLGVFQTGKEKMSACMEASYGRSSGQPGPGATITVSPIYQTNPPPPAGGSSGTFGIPAEQEACVKAALGGNFDRWQREGYLPTEDEVAKMKVCFPTNGSAPPPTSEPHPSEAVFDSCAKEVLGEENGGRFRRGEYVSSQEEYEKIKSCFVSR